jgi:hypothetical protein
MSKRFVLDRRTVLRGMLAGAGVAVGLPTLEAMFASDRAAYAAGAKVRYLSWFFGNGVLPDEWDPTMDGPGWTSPLTQALDLDPEVKKYVSILTGFNCKLPNSKKISHHEGMIIFNGYPFQYVNGLSSYAGGPTLDHVIAERLAGQTTVHSLQLGVSRKLSYMDGGTTMHNLSHKAAGQAGALSPQFNPQSVFNSLFGNFEPEFDADGPLRVSVLDAVSESTKRLEKRLGKLDKERLDAHLTAISQLQTKIAAAPPSCTLPEATEETNPESGPERIDETIDAMHELIVYAWSCDLTRAVSLLVHGGAAATAFTNIGHSEEHHMDNSHQQLPNWKENMRDVVGWHMGKLQKLLARLYETPDGTNGNLLDNSMVFVSSDCSVGMTHSVDDQPMLVCGGGGGQLLTPGTHYHSTTGENPTDVLLTMLQCIDPAATSVGGEETASTTPCTQIKKG